ncbi:MAG: ferredoxin [Verrucomicrobiales bacterium]|nr:ferredoxin [Verrucomicrobiales bacterium]
MTPAPVKINPPAVEESPVFPLKSGQEDFRDHLATADKQGNRKWVYPKQVKGRFYRYRTYASWLLLAIMFSGPFIRINGNPLLLINVVERRFSVLGQIFWPQDMIILAVALLLFFMSIIIFSTAFGRLWCGWTCPQTLLMEMVFRKIEYAIEEDANAQRALDAQPWNGRKIRIKLFKHAIFFALSFIIGNTLLSYIIGTENLFVIITDNPLHHVSGLVFMVLFTGIFYALFARFREQACTFICPYGRFQSAILDENSMVVAYDHKRGETRGPLSRSQTPEMRKEAGTGDCVNCRLCVAVCPTGIDIRNGTQMECVNCTACIDACDFIMDKVKKPRGLIRYASLNTIETGEKQRFTARMGWYTVILSALVCGLAFLLFTRTDVETTMLRAPGALFQKTAEGKIENLYTVKVINKTNRDIPVELKLENLPGNLKLMGAGQIIAPKANLIQASVLIEMDPATLGNANAKLKIGVYSGGKRLKILTTTFIGPRL